MPRNFGKGGKKRKKGKGLAFQKRELQFKEDGQEYAQVTKMLGGARIEAYCFDGQKRQCRIRGKICRREWMKVGDYVLIGLRDFEDDKADVLTRFREDEARQLKAYGELPESAEIMEDLGYGEEEGENIEFRLEEDEIDMI